MKMKPCTVKDIESLKVERVVSRQVLNQAKTLLFDFDPKEAADYFNSLDGLLKKLNRDYCRSIPKDFIELSIRSGMITKDFYATIFKYFILYLEELDIEKIREVLGDISSHELMSFLINED